MPMNQTNWVGETSWIKAMRQALMECVPLMTPRWASLYSGHAMRVGGSNYMRRIGMDDDIHRRMGGWMTLTAAQGYMALSAAEQFRYTVSLAAETKRRSALTRHRARAVLAALPTMH